MNVNKPISAGKKPAFRKEDFVIKNVKDNSFSQIDSFKVTAKKVESVANSQQVGYGYQGQTMHNFPTAMQQNFSFNPLMQTQAFAQTSQSTSFNSMPGGLPNQHMMYGMPPSQMLPGAYQMVQQDSMQYAAADQRVPVSHVPQGALPHQMMQAAPATSAMHHAANGVEIPPTSFNQFFTSSSASHVPQNNFSQFVSSTSNSVTQSVSNCQTTQGSAASSSNMLPPTMWVQNSQMSQFPDSNIPPTPLMSQQLYHTQWTGAPTSVTTPQSTENTGDSINALSSKVDDDFGDFSQIGSTLPEQPANNTTDDFQEFASFGAPVEPSTDSHVIAEASSGNTGGIVEVPGSAMEDFGDFSHVPDSSSSQVKPLPTSLDGKRMTIVVKKNLGAKSASSSNRLPASSKTSSHSATSAKVKQTTGPGLGNLAESLAAATSQLTQPKPTPIEEQKDFSILQEVVSNIDKAKLPPIVKEPDTSFTLPDTPTKLDEIFPKCTPKRSSHVEDDTFQDFASFPLYSNSPVSAPSASPTISAVNTSHLTNGEFGNFANFSTSSTQQDEGFGSFAAPASVTRQAAINSETPLEAVKSHAVDWSSFSALDELRAEEEEGVLGDFSVFGSTLKPASEEAAGDQPNFLMSPEHKVSQPSPFSLESTGLTNQITSASVNQTEQEEEWADFAEPSANAEAEDWAAFSEPQIASAIPSSLDEPINDQKSLGQPITGQELLGQPITRHEIPSYLRTDVDVSSIGSADGIGESSVPTRNSLDLLNDNDSIFSGNAFSADNYADNASSDWSFKDNTSNVAFDDLTNAFNGSDSSKVAVEATKHISLSDNLFGGVTLSADLATENKQVFDWSKNDKNSTDWSNADVQSSTNTEVEPVDWAADFSSADIQPGSSSAADWMSSSGPAHNEQQSFDWLNTAIKDEDDEWEAFGSIDRSKPAVESVTLEEPQALAEENIPELKTEISESISFHDSPPPFSPSDTPSHSASHFDWGFNQGEGALAEDNNDKWSVFAELQETAVDKPSTPNVADGLVAEGFVSAEVTLPPNSLPPDDVPNDGDVNAVLDNARSRHANVTKMSPTLTKNLSEDTDSPLAFSPPPLTDLDFSPSKSLPRVDSDWFSFPTADEVVVRDKNEDMDELTNNFSKAQLGDFENKESEFVAIDKVVSCPDTLPTDISRSDRSAVVFIQSDDESDYNQPPPLPDVTPVDEELPSVVGGEDFDDFYSFPSKDFNTLPSFSTDVPQPQDITKVAEDDELRSATADGFQTDNRMSEDKSFDNVKSSEEQDDGDWGFQPFSAGADFKDEEIAERSTNSPRIENESWGFGITNDTREDGEWNFPSPSLQKKTEPVAEKEDDNLEGFSGNDGFGDFSDKNGFGDLPDEDGFGDFPDNDSFGDFPDEDGFGDFPNKDGFGDFPEEDGFGDFPDEDGFGDFPDKDGFGDFPDKDGFGDFPDEDGFGDFPEEGNFQGFSESSRSSAPSAVAAASHHDATPPQSDNMSQVLNPTKISSLFNSVFSAAESSVTPPMTSTTLLDSVNANSVWSSLTDLNQSVSLQLQWLDSRSHCNLLNSLHLTLPSSSLLQPLPVGPDSSSAHSSALPPVTLVKQLPVTDARKPSPASGVGGMAMFDFDFLSDTNITNNNSIALSAAPANTPSTKSSTNLFDDFL